LNQLVGQVAIALLNVSLRAEEVQGLVEEDGDFVREAERDGQEALEGFLKGTADWGRVESDRLCELIWRVG
jgi:hypothetical protein